MHVKLVEQFPSINVILFLDWPIMLAKLMLLQTLHVAVVFSVSIRFRYDIMNI